MQAMIDSVAQSFTSKPPIFAERSGADREQVTQFAMQLLANYKSQLEKRVPRLD